MKALILAAGWGKRARPLAFETPKPLLRLGGRCVIDLTVEAIHGVGDTVQQIFVLTNRAYRARFDSWWRDRGIRDKVLAPIDDGTEYEGQKLGAIGDIQWFFTNGRIEGDEALLVIAGDNVFKFDLTKFLNAYQECKTSLVAVHEPTEPFAARKRYGRAKLDPETNRIVDFKEKVDDPKLPHVSSGCYVFSARHLALIDRYVGETGKTDDIGSFIEWLVSRNGDKISGYPFTEFWDDIDDDQSYAKLRQKYFLERIEASPEYWEVMDAVILFADIVGSVTISEHVSLSEYDKIVSEFQETALNTVDQILNRNRYTKIDRDFCEYSARGDELVLILYGWDMARDIRTALTTAVEIKRRWLLSSFNQHRIREGKFFYDLGVGVHCGEVVVGRHPGSTRRFNAEGYAINLAKRIETASREGRFSRIMLSKNVPDRASGIGLPARFGRVSDIAFRGMYGTCPVLELEVYGEIDDQEAVEKIRAHEIPHFLRALERQPSDLWLLLTVARYYYDEEEYREALTYYDQALDRYREFGVAHLYRGRTLYRQNRFAEAEESLKRAVEYEPLSARSHAFLATTYRRLGQYEAAVREYRKAIELDPRYPFAYNGLAFTIAEARSGAPGDWDLEEARQQVNRAAQLFQELGLSDQHGHLTTHTRSLISLWDFQWESAISGFTETQQMVRGNISLRRRERERLLLEAEYHMGLTYWHSGHRDQALKSFRISMTAQEIPMGERGYYWFADAQEKIRQMPRANRKPG
jgi:glucose-1-phosphate thymidylyltransferase